MSIFCKRDHSAVLGLGWNKIEGCNGLLVAPFIPFPALKSFQLLWKWWMEGLVLKGGLYFQWQAIEGPLGPFQEV